MTESFWLFGSYLTILADRTTTGGQYDSKVTFHQALKLHPIATPAILSKSMCSKENSPSGLRIEGSS